MSAIDVTAADIRKLAQLRQRVEVLEPLSRLERLHALLSSRSLAEESELARSDEEQSVSASLRFSQDSRGRARVEGRLGAPIVLACNRCLDARPFRLESQLVLTLLDDRGVQELPAEERTELDIAVVDLKAADLLALIEDELLLALPTQVCADDDCPRRPAMSFAPAANEDNGEEAAGEPSAQASERSELTLDDADRQRPFAGLKTLLEAHQRGTEEHEAPVEGPSADRKT